MSLKFELFSLMGNTERLCQDCRDATDLLETLQEMRTRLEMPLRIAVVGIMKAGKSTFLNALMGRNILFTGTLETTYTVCWFRYADTPFLTICFRDNTQLNVPFEDLEKWSVRKYETENPRLNDVKYLIIYYPAEVLKTMEFIDTPGLDSVYGTDAQNTLDFLAIKGSEDTLYEVGLADAIIYAFTRTAQSFDQKILDAFHSGGEQTASPINSVGILTKVDATGIWNVTDEAIPIEVAKGVTSSIMDKAEMKRLLFTVLPICAKTCEGFIQMEAQDWEVIGRIAEVDHNKLKDELLFDSGYFSTCEDKEYLDLGTPEERKRLLDMIGQYGILEIARQLRLNKSKEEIGTILQETCGIQSIQELLLNHFGNRTFLIKAQYIFNHLRGLIHKIRINPQTSSELLGICTQLSEGIENLMVSQQTLKNLTALQMYYNRQLQFSDEEERQDFLRVTGEYGRCVENRLGVSTNTSIAEMAKLAQQKVSSWRRKASDHMMSRNSYVEVASIVARSYEQIYYHLNALMEE